MNSLSRCSDTYSKYQRWKWSHQVRMDHRQQTGKMTFSGPDKEQPEVKDKCTLNLKRTARIIPFPDNPITACHGKGSRVFHNNSNEIDLSNKRVNVGNRSDECNLFHAAHVCAYWCECYLDDVKRDPFTEPKHDNPTNTGIIQAIGPRW